MKWVQGEPVQLAIQEFLVSNHRSQIHSVDWHDLVADVHSS